MPWSRMRPCAATTSASEGCLRLRPAFEGPTFHHAPLKQHHITLSVNGQEHPLTMTRAATLLQILRKPCATAIWFGGFILAEGNHDA